MHLSDLSAALLAFGLAAQVMAIPLPADEPIAGLEDRDVPDLSQEEYVEPMAVVIEARDVWKILEVRKKSSTGKPKSPVGSTGKPKPKPPVGNTGKPKTPVVKTRDVAEGPTPVLEARKSSNTGKPKPKPPVGTTGKPKVPVKTRGVAAEATPVLEARKKGSTGKPKSPVGNTGKPKVPVKTRGVDEVAPRATDQPRAEVDERQVQDLETLEAGDADVAEPSSDDVEAAEAEGLDARSAQDEDETAEEAQDQQAESVGDSGEDSAGAVEEATVDEGAIVARDEVEQSQEEDESEFGAADASEAET
ncbi:uncharacterized protein PG998_010472 [Apiospora kogelbergensis]|uniref:uncharacterized protein n=1 Tax=Apiospora kogelbergensis TaxID=1337665 RepID=UPI003132108B